LTVTKINRQDTKNQTSLKGSCGMYAVIDNGCFYVAGKTRKEAEALQRFLQVLKK